MSANFTEIEYDAKTGDIIYPPGSKEYLVQRFSLIPFHLHKSFTIRCVPYEESQPEIEQLNEDGSGHVGGTLAKLAVGILLLGYAFAERSHEVWGYTFFGSAIFGWGAYDLGQAIKQLRRASFLEKKELLLLAQNNTPNSSNQKN